MPDKRDRSKRAPKRNKRGKKAIAPPPEPQDFNKSTPRFCLRHLESNHCVGRLTVDQRADFAMALEARARMTWSDLIRADRHGLGLETLPADQIKPQIPVGFEDTSKFQVFRYSGRLPMIGTRTNDTFHVIWIEADFGDVYDHGD